MDNVKKENDIATVKKKNVIYSRYNSDIDDFEVARRLENMIKEIDVKIDAIYVDNGYSGNNFDRPKFKELLKDVERGLISTIYINDVSRLGRNFIAVDEYITKYFPKHNVKLVSLDGEIENFTRFVENVIRPILDYESNKRLQTQKKIKEQAR